MYSSPALDTAVGTMSASVRAKLQATSGFATPHVYLNYDQGDEGPAAWWGPSLARLRAIKAKWDPDNLFGKGAPMN
jgi:fumiquinazoline A oxidase